MRSGLSIAGSWHSRPVEAIGLHGRARVGKFDRAARIGPREEWRPVDQIGGGFHREHHADAATGGRIERTVRTPARRNQTRRAVVVVDDDVRLGIRSGRGAGEVAEADMDRFIRLGERVVDEIYQQRDVRRTGGDGAATSKLCCFVWRSKRDSWSSVMNA